MKKKKKAFLVVAVLIIIFLGGCISSTTTNALITSSKSTKILNRNVLSRKKRYLTFPKGSNFIITMSFIKAFLQVQPRGWNFLGECDVPFGLPSDTRFFKNFKRNHKIQRREVYTQLEEALSLTGANGKSCVNSMICQAHQFLSETSENSLIKQFASVIFGTTQEMEEYFQATYGQYCGENLFKKCNLPVLNYILHTILYK